MSKVRFCETAVSDCHVSASSVERRPTTAGTTEVTLRNRYRGLREALERLDVTPSDLAQGKA